VLSPSSTNPRYGSWFVGGLGLGLAEKVWIPDLNIFEWVGPKPERAKKKDMNEEDHTRPGPVAGHL